MPQETEHSDLALPERATADGLMHLHALDEDALALVHVANGGLQSGAVGTVHPDSLIEQGRPCPRSFRRPPE
jgi:hypothetical protein